MDRWFASRVAFIKWAEWWNMVVDLDKDIVTTAVNYRFVRPFFCRHKALVRGVALFSNKTRLTRRRSWVCYFKQHPLELR
jgi:hypothetical protein